MLPDDYLRKLRQDLAEAGAAFDTATRLASAKDGMEYEEE
jgi:hypothetical protein